MARNINLLPQELGAGSRVLQLGKVLSRISIILITLFLISGIGGIGYLFLLQNQINNTLAQNNQLETSIRNLEITEQKLVLVKDRVTKIKNIFSQDTAYNNVVNVKDVFSGLPSDVNLDEASITSASVRFSVTSKSSLGMAAFLNNLTAQTNFKQMTLRNFSFRPTTGYTITVEAN